MRGSDCFKRVYAVFASFTDANQDASSEWNFEFASPLERVEPALWNFVGCTSMTIKVVAQRFDHHALRRRNAAQHCQLVFIQRTGICMRQ